MKQTAEETKKDPRVWSCFNVRRQAWCGETHTSFTVALAHCHELGGPRAWDVFSVAH